MTPRSVLRNFGV